MEDVIYEVNGRRLTFTHVQIEEGYFKGYNRHRKKWAWLFEKYFQFEGESIILATKIR